MPLEIQLKRLFHHQHFNLYRFHEKLRIISELRKSATENFQDMFRYSGIQETDIKTF